MSENSGVAVITIEINPPLSDGTATVSLSTGDGGAVAPGDYTSVSGNLTFTAGQTSQSFNVPIVNDALDEADETLTLTLFNVNNAVLSAPNPATLTIIDDDSTPTIQFSQASYSVIENGGPVTITAILSTLSGFPISVEYETSDGTAAQGSDYSATAGTLTFAPGQNSQTFTVPVISDVIDELDETVTLTLKNPSGGNTPGLGSPNPATLVIIDDDQPPTVQFSSQSYSVAEDSLSGSALITTTLAPPSGQVVTVDFASKDGTAIAGADYQAVANTLTFAPGQTVSTFVVPITNDVLNENITETLTLTLTNAVKAVIGPINPATLAIIEDDVPTLQFDRAGYDVSEGAGTVTLTATLSTTSTRAITATYLSSDQTTTVGDDYVLATGTISFTPGQTITTVPLTLIDDNLTNEFSETLSLTLSNPQNSLLGAPNPTTVTLVDNDGQPEVGFVTTNYATSEGDVSNNTDLITTTVVVTLNAPSALTVTVNYTETGGTATAGDDYQGPIGGGLTFTPNEVARSFNVVVISDTLDETLTETINLALINPISATLGSDAAAFLIVDDDPIGPSCSPDPSPPSPPEPDIGPPDGQFIVVDCQEALVVDVSALPISSSGTSFPDMVFYERGQPDPPTTTNNIFMDWVIVQVGQSSNGPWFTVFYWGDEIRDTNSNLGQSSFGLPETESKNIPALNPDMPLFQSPPPFNLITGIAIDIDARAPPGTYNYVRFYSPYDPITNDPFQVDAIHPLPFP